MHHMSAWNSVGSEGTLTRLADGWKSPDEWIHSANSVPDFSLLLLLLVILVIVVVVVIVIIVVVIAVVVV